MATQDMRLTAARIAGSMTIAGGNVGPEPVRPSAVILPFPPRGRFAATKEVERDG